jgi:hypothetical protein
VVHGERRARGSGSQPTATSQCAGRRRGVGGVSGNCSAAVGFDEDRGGDDVEVENGTEGTATINTCSLEYRYMSILL